MTVIDGYRAEGYAKFQLKVGGNYDQDILRIRQCREPGARRAGGDVRLSLLGAPLSAGTGAGSAAGGPGS